MVCRLNLVNHGLELLAESGGGQAVGFLAIEPADGAHLDQVRVAVWRFVLFEDAHFHFFLLDN